MTNNKAYVIIWVSLLIFILILYLTPLFVGHNYNSQTNNLQYKIDSLQAKNDSLNAMGFVYTIVDTFLYVDTTSWIPGSKIEYRLIYKHKQGICLPK